MNDYRQNILSDLKDLHWQTLANTYGNDHSTIIGMIVQWWIKLSPQSHIALDGAPNYGYRKRTERGSGQCDAMLCENEKPIGIVEVEGSKFITTAKKIAKYFKAEYYDLNTLQFAIFLCYSGSPVGRSSNKEFPDPVDTETLSLLKTISSDYPDKLIILIKLTKKYEPRKTGILSKNEYYSGRTNKIIGSLFVAGQEENPIEFLNI